MTRIPGRLLLKVARVVFDDSVVEAVVTPTVSDLQQEVREAGDDGAARLGALLRGYTAFWTLVLGAPVAFHRWPTRSIGEPGIDRNPGIAFSLIIATVVLCAWSFLGVWTLVAIAGGALFATMIHRWHTDHPTQLVVPEKGVPWCGAIVWRGPEINQSKIPVDGNIAGLMYVVGSLVVVLIGLPLVRWFFLTTMVLGLLCAVALLVWHGARPSRTFTLLAR